MKVNFIYQYRGPLYSLLFLGFLGLSFLNNYLNFTRTSTEIRDAAPVFGTLTTLEKLDLSEKKVEIAKTNASAPFKSASASAGFLIKNPAPTSDNSYLSPYESGVKVYKDRFFFAHSTAAFNWIKYAGEGDTFSVERNGTTETYRIVKKQVLSMTENYNGRYPVPSYYNSISERAQFLGKTYDVALMTCGDGTTGKNGNNSDYRTFIFANRV